MRREIPPKKRKKESRRAALVAALIACFFTVGCAAKEAETGTEAGNKETTTLAATESTTETETTKETETTTEEPETVTILGEDYTLDVEALDLSACTPEELPKVSEALGAFTELKSVQLMDEKDTSRLSPADVLTLKEAAPNAEFTYSFDLFDQRISLSDKAIRYIGKNIGNEGAAELRTALSLLDEGTYLLLDDCGIDDEVLAKLREEFPDKKLVWRVHVGNKTALTDDTVIRMTHGIDDTMTGPLKYCTDVVYMDLGHDDTLTDISFTAYMPDLECLILSGSRVSDLSPLKNCKSLAWLELCYCDRVNDLSELSEMDFVKYLNISYTGVRDLSPIETWKLERLCCIGNGISQETINAFEASHPDCMTSFSGSPWGYAWRYDDHGYHFFSYYARMREVFRYTGSSPGGFKFPEYVNPWGETAPEPEEEKKPEPKPAPQPEPEPTPEPQPEVNPEPAPEPQPEVSPEPTPEPQPEVSPEPTPEPQPEVSPEPQPEAGSELPSEPQP